MMQIYLVGGAVRDQLLSLPIKDKDWVVVGATPEQLLEQGFQPVGKDFPVFLHPQTKQEYALARTERKAGQGYTGFICDSNPNVSLEQDLLRRDLTINAIAQDSQGRFYDPYGGIQDLQQRLLRHVSPAFSEDPLRVLRVARFAARFHYLGFKVAEETLILMQQISQTGELSTLSAERVWRETEKALNENNPDIYFQVLQQVGALAVLFPELDKLNGVPNPAKHHPEIDSFIHSLMVLQQATQLSQHHPHKSAVRFAAICHDLGKGLTPKSLYPHHYGHEQKGLIPLAHLCQRLKVPNEFTQLAQICCQYHSHIHRAYELRPETIIKLFNHIDVWRKPERLQDLLLVCQADSQGRLGFEQRPYPQKEYIAEAYQLARQVDIQQIIAEGYQKQGIKNELNKRRIQVIRDYKNRVKNTLHQSSI